MRNSFKVILFILVVAAAAASGQRPADAQGAWCTVSYERDNGGENCGFSSFEQCMDTARGLAALCVRNLNIPPPAPAAKAPAKKPRPAQK